MIKRLSFRRDEAGATAVEFAFVGPLFLLFLFGIMQVGIWALSAVSLQHAAELAARCAAVKSANCGCAAGVCTVDAIQSFAARQVTVLTVPATAFRVQGVPTAVSCGSSSGVSVSVNDAGYSVQYTPINFTSWLNLPTYTPTASACYPSS